MTRTEIILASFSLALFAVGYVAWFQRWKSLDWSQPVYRVPSEAYRLLERIRDRLFSGSRDVRLTIFRPDPDSPLELRPIARIGWGRHSANSSARFREGEGLAGLAAMAEYRDGIVVTRVSSFDSLERARDAHKKAFHLSDEAADRLSQEQLTAPVLIATSLMQGRIFKGVLCIDSRDPALVPVDMADAFWGRLDKCAAELARALPAPQPHAAREGVPSPGGIEGIEIEKVHVWAEEFQAPQLQLPGMSRKAAVG